MTAVIIQPEWFDTKEFIAPKYKNSADCINTRSTQGRNATPLDIFPAVRDVLGEIELDPASDELINEGVQADRILTFEDDGLSQPWKANSVFLNPPGNTITGGTYAERLYWSEQLVKSDKQRKEENIKRPKDVKSVSAAKWYRKLYQEWKARNVKRAIALVYRGGSIGSLGYDILSLPICFTCLDVSSPIIKGGRLSFEIIEDEVRKPETSNTQSSMFVLFPDSDDCVQRFRESFDGVLGAVKV
jgi:DNA N-6-adenine-methyltransferase (Dam)